MKKNDEEKVAATKRLLIETDLTKRYQGQLIRLTDLDGFSTSTATYEKYGTVRSIGVESTGADQFEVIINLDGTRVVFPYQEFIDNVTILQ